MASTSLFILGLIILFFTYFLFFILPNTVVFFLYITGFIQILFNYPLGFTDGLTGMVSGIVFFYLIAKLYKIIRKKEGMGMGDIKLLGALGLWLGWKSLFFIIIISALLGIIFGIIAISLGKMKIQSKIPYGCFEINRNGKMIKMLEKPKQNYLVNTGLYLMNSKILQIIPKKTKLDFNILLSNLIKKDFKIGFFTIDENSWRDFGEISSFTKKI